MWERYCAPTQLDQALLLLAQHQAEARVVAGGTDLLLEIERKLRTPRMLIDITRIAGLDEIRLEGQEFHIGPLVTHNLAAASPLLVERAYPVARACWEVGAPQIRNCGTLAGNLITASPANDTIAPLWALGASVTLKSTRGQRSLPFEQFFKGVRKTALQPDELLVDISFPAMNPQERGTFIKLGLRKSQAISIVNAAAVVGFEGDIVRTARLTFGSVAPTIIRALEAESFLVGKQLAEATIREAGELAMHAARPIGDIRSPADYRTDMVRVLTERVLRQLADGTERADWPKNPAMLWGKTDGRFPTGISSSATHTAGGDEPILTTVNGQPYTVRGANDQTLLHLLREGIGLTGTKEGCAEGECGACTVSLDGIAVMACLVPAPRAHGAHIITIEGLAQGGKLDPVQQAFIDADAIQCGYCTPGFIMSGAKLLEEFPRPDRAQIEQSISGNLCRCTGYVNIVRAIEGKATNVMERPPVGGSNIRVDSVAKVTGQTRYVEDIVMPGLLHAKVLRSPHHHARLLSLTLDQAAHMPGVVRIIASPDVPGLNGLDGYSRDEPVLTPVGDTLRQKGAPIALVVAETRRQAEAAAAAIKVEYEVLPHTFDADKALEPDALPIYPGGNKLSDYAVKHGDLEAAFAASDVIVETRYRTTFQEHSTLERDATLGYIDEQGRVTVVGGTHEPHWQQGYIAQTLGLDPSRVRVIFPPTGGSFGDRQDPWPLVAAGLIAHLVRRPVRLSYSRREVFDATPKRHPYNLEFKIGATAAGRLTGIRVRVNANTGGYDSAGYWIPNYAVTCSGGPYVYRAVDAYAQAVYTNAAKCGQFRGFGSPQSMFALECTLDELCQQLQTDPLEFRLKNRIHQDSICFLGYPVAEKLGYAEVLEATRPRYQAFLQEAAAFNASHEGAARRMGVGLAGMWYRFGKSGSLRVETHAELARDGHFIVYCSAPDYGQGTNTVMTQLAAEAFGVPRERIELVNADTATTPDSGIQGASRATFFIGNSVCNAARNLTQHIFGAASELLDHHPADLSLAADRVMVKGDQSRSVSLAEVAQELERLGKSRKVMGLFDLTPLFPDDTRAEYTPHFVTGAQAAQVVVDMETGQVQVNRLVAVHDVGHAINPPNAVGQIQGAVMMGVGTALTEEYVQGVSTGFTDYILPMASAVPDIKVIMVEVPSYHGPLGAKGLGEAAILPTAPAIVNAISRAIGVRIRELPASPPRVLKAIKSR